MKEIEENDKNEEETKAITKQELQAKIEIISKRKEKYVALKAKMEETGKRQISNTDPDSRRMMNNRKMEVCYNVQTVVDGKNKLILDYKVTNEVSDINQLSNMVTKAQNILQTEKIEVLADKGYYKSTEIKECIDEGMVPYVSKPETSGGKGYKVEKFEYIKEKDIYICSGKQELTYRKKGNKDGKVIKFYKTKACKNCEIRSQCTNNKTGREIQRWEYEEILEEMKKRLRENVEKYFLRRCLSEHPFGTIKRTMNAAYVLMKGFGKVKAEISTIMLSYNIKRVINIIGVKKLVEILG